MITLNYNDFSFKTDQESLEYFREIVELMMIGFGIKPEEAIGRINQSWNHVEEVLKDDNELFREFPYYWSNHFYYGKESFWWIENRHDHGLSELKPLPYNK